MPLRLKPWQGEQEYDCDPGTSYILCHHTMSNCPTWVDKPDTFSPERWTRSDQSEHCPHSRDNQASVNQIHPFVSLPFGFGPRMCIGRRLAMMEVTLTIDLLRTSSHFSSKVSVLLSEIISRYKVSWHGQHMKIKTNIIVFPDTDLKFSFQRR